MSARNRHFQTNYWCITITTWNIPTCRTTTWNIPRYFTSTTLGIFQDVLLVTLQQPFGISQDVVQQLGIFQNVVQQLGLFQEVLQLQQLGIFQDFVQQRGIFRDVVRHLGIFLDVQQQGIYQYVFNSLEYSNIF